MKTLKLLLIGLVLGMMAVVPTFAATSAVGTAQANSCINLGDQADGLYILCYLGVDYNPDGTSDWTYSLENVNAQNLSHVVFETCEPPIGGRTLDEYNGVVSNPQGRSYPTAWGPDKKTFGPDFDVFKFDETLTAPGELEIFQFTMQGSYAEGDIRVGTKSGTGTGFDQGLITGPIAVNGQCSEVTPPTPEPTTTPDTPEPTPTPTEPPTAITLDSFTVSARGNVVTINWETATETNNAGFNIYRIGVDGAMVKVNDKLVPAAVDATGGNVYSITDTPGFGQFTYVLEDVDLYGLTTQHDSNAVQLLSVRRPMYRPSIVR